MQGNLREILGGLMEVRYPVYAEADRVIDTAEQPPDTIVAAIVDMLRGEAEALARDDGP